VSILNPLFEAVAWVISRIHDALSVPFGAGSGWSWGLSIVLLVCLMRLIMVPLFVKQVKSQRKMQSHMPALQEIRKRYKNDKTRLNEETMKFYKENGINPLGGCLPLVAQLPVFWSLFNVLKAIADWTPVTNGHVNVPQYGLSVATVESARHAHIFGVLLSDKFLWAATGESWTVRAVILASVAVSATTTFLTMRQSAKRGMMNQQMPDPDQPGAAMAQSMSKNMMYIAPFFALTGLYWQYGLVIYWVTTNVWTLGQQHILFRNLPIVGSATVGASAVSAASGSNGSAARNSAAVRSGAGVRSAPVKSSLTAAKSNGTAKAASKPGTGTKPSNGTKPSTGAKPSTGTKPSTTATPGTATKPSTTATPGTATKPATAGTTATAKVPASKASTSGSPAAKSASNGAANSGMVSSSEASGGRGLLGFGKKKQEPQDDVPVVPETKVVRQQPVRQARAKRSGSSGSSGKK
jgi:YidC/Oxa1 family membrane protein insertase